MIDTSSVRMWHLEQGLMGAIVMTIVKHPVEKR